MADPLVRYVAAANLALAALISSEARADSPVIPQSCRAVLDSKLPGWKFAAIPHNVLEWSAANGRPTPAVTSGDYDGNGRHDWAVLVEHGGTTKVAVCLSAAVGTQLSVIGDPYCTDALDTSPARSEHYNFDTDKIEVIAHDGISVSCFEKAGATYVYERGVFRRIVDSD